MTDIDYEDYYHIIVDLRSFKEYGQEGTSRSPAWNRLDTDEAFERLLEEKRWENAIQYFRKNYQETALENSRKNIQSQAKDTDTTTHI